ncbi:LSMD1 domain-containing protein Sbat [Arctopsyche grandis]|uniref:LSMD1 domain-containing protein Sbat n=1 Tax=Arctopsyche grandis TaxID=121162 RepID=UPI00406D68AB
MNETETTSTEETVSETLDKPPTPILSEGRQKLKGWIDKHFRIVMTDGRTLIGYFLCTDRDANIILGTCEEYLKSEMEGEEPRFLGLVMVPGRHIVSIELNDKTQRKNLNIKGSPT